LDKDQEILQAAIDAIADRASIRDLDGEKSMSTTTDMFNGLTGQMVTEREGWIFMVCLKLSRSQQGRFHEDDYIDAAAYIALAGAAAHGEVRPSRNGPPSCKNVRKDEDDVHGFSPDETNRLERAILDLHRLSEEKTKEGHQWGDHTLTCAMRDGYDCNCRDDT